MDAAVSQHSPCPCGAQDPVKKMDTDTNGSGPGQHLEGDTCGSPHKRMTNPVGTGGIGWCPAEAGSKTQCSDQDQRERPSTGKGAESTEQRGSFRSRDSGRPLAVLSGAGAQKGVRDGQSSV